MERIKLFGTGALVVCALSLAVLPVSSASAKDVLQLNENGVAAANEAPAELAIDLAGCFPTGQGHLTGNDGKKVTATMTHNETPECGKEGSTLTGAISSETLETNGNLDLAGSVTITEDANLVSGPCIYTYKKFKFKGAKVSGPAEFSGKVAGKLVKGGSNADCPKASDANIALDLFDQSFEPFEVALVP